MTLAVGLFANLPMHRYLDSHLEAELADGFTVLAGLLQLVSTGLTSKEGQPTRLTGLAAGFVSSM